MKNPAEQFSFITLIACLAFFHASAQTEQDTIKVLAVLTSPAEGDKIHIAKYRVVKELQGRVSNKNIRVGCYFYKKHPEEPDTAVLTLIPYGGSTEMPDYYIFPDYDAAAGTEPARISDISFEYWEGCETGKGECKPLSFSRSSIHEKWFLLMPCGGTQTSVGLSTAGKGPIRQLDITSEECPPVFDITDLEDGKYTAYMLACGLGGPVEVNLITKQ